MYTDEKLEDHRRLELRPYWSFLKGSFFAYEPAPADGGVGICWEKEVQTWTLPTLLGIYGHQFSLKQLWYAWENLPIAVKRHSRGQRGGGAQGAQDRIVERKKIQKETMDFLEQIAVAKANLGGGVAFDLARSWDTAGGQALHQPHAGSCDGFAGGRCG